MYQKVGKRLLDILLSVILLVILSPIFIFIALAVKIFVRGNVIYIHERAGLKGKTFKLYKFKSLYDEIDKNGNILSLEERRGKFGKILRRSKLDELPQLFNVLKGEMSLVGPRPLRAQYIKLYDEKQIRRLDVKPGLTGLAQINSKASTPWNEYFMYDLEYIRTLSFKNDLCILLKTFILVTIKGGKPLEDRLTSQAFSGKNGH